MMESGGSENFSAVTTKTIEDWRQLIFLDASSTIKLLDDLRQSFVKIQKRLESVIPDDFTELEIHGFSSSLYSSFTDTITSRLSSLKEEFISGRYLDYTDVINAIKQCQDHRQNVEGMNGAITIDDILEPDDEAATSDKKVVDHGSEVIEPKETVVNFEDKISCMEGMATNAGDDLPQLESNNMEHPLALSEHDFEKESTSEIPEVISEVLENIDHKHISDITSSNGEDEATHENSDGFGVESVSGIQCDKHTARNEDIAVKTELDDDLWYRSSHAEASNDNNMVMEWITKGSDDDKPDEEVLRENPVDAVEGCELLQDYRVCNLTEEQEEASQEKERTDTLSLSAPSSSNHEASENSPANETERISNVPSESASSSRQVFPSNRKALLKKYGICPVRVNLTDISKIRSYQKLIAVCRQKLQLNVDFESDSEHSASDHSSRTSSKDKKIRRKRDLSRKVKKNSRKNGTIKRESDMTSDEELDALMKSSDHVLNWQEREYAAGNSSMKNSTTDDNQKKRNRGVGSAVKSEIVPEAEEIEEAVEKCSENDQVNGEMQEEKKYEKECGVRNNNSDGNDGGSNDEKKGDANSTKRTVVAQHDGERGHGISSETKAKSKSTIKHNGETRSGDEEESDDSDEPGEEPIIIDSDDSDVKLLGMAEKLANERLHLDGERKEKRKKQGIRSKRLQSRRRIVSSDSEKGSTKSGDDFFVEESSVDSEDSEKSSSTSQKQKNSINKKKVGGLPRKERGKKRRRVTASEESSSGDDDDDEVETEKKSPGKRLRRMLTDDKLQKETVDAEKAEKERRKRLELKQKEFNGIKLTSSDDLVTALGHENRLRVESVVLDNDKNGTPPCPVVVHPSLVKVLKPHQANGIQFLYNSCIESLDRLNEEGGGGILAHCMGLGKTLQVIAFLHTIMMHPKTSKKIKHVLVVVPKNVVLNWYNEFEKWLDNDDIDRSLSTIDIMELDSFKTYSDRYVALKNWYENEQPSIMLIGYDMFRILTAEEDDKGKKSSTKSKTMVKKNKRLMKYHDGYCKFLQNPGPDLVVCDEAHKLKNDGSVLAKTMAKIRTKLRLCLTGTPLQNNLIEYHCMVSFVKPGLLGTKEEFSNRFVNIINAGRTKESTPREVRRMRQRCHVLHRQLENVVDRKDYKVLRDSIPPKQEYVINVRLTSRQITLYKTFIEGVGDDGIGLSKRLLPDYHILSRIWTHPYQLVMHEIEAERKRILQEDLDEVNDFIDDGETSGSNETDDDDLMIIEPPTSKLTDEFQIGEEGSRRSRRLAGEDTELTASDMPMYRTWFTKDSLVTESDKNAFELSNKLNILVEVIKKCESIGDKLLVFSQSLESIGLIKRMLKYFDENNLWFSDGHEVVKSDEEKWHWREGYDFMVIDGGVASARRQDMQIKFNDPNNLRARLMLISTRAGSLGINMVAANRVLIFDCCWNPSHDTQSLFRVYRFGQTKPVYIYRLIAQGTMEEMIYKRQVTKESTSLRVIDEAQIQRHFDGNDLHELYRFSPVELDSAEDQAKRSVLAPPKDRMLADIISSHREWLVDYIVHDTLFEDMEDEKLTEEECKAAWEDYEREKTMVPSRINITSDRMLMGDSFLAYSQQLPLNGQVMLAQFRSDPVTMQVIRYFPDVNLQLLLDIFTMRKSMDCILSYLPMDRRGNIYEFTTFFVSQIEASHAKGETAQNLLTTLRKMFQVVMNIAREYPHCASILQQIERSIPQNFEAILEPQINISTSA